MEPCAGALDTSTTPWCWRTMPCTTARPSPVPRPGALVVKKGSKMRSSVPAGMPAPVSFTESSTMRRPGTVAWRVAKSAPTSTFRVRTVRLPPSGMASRALTQRFISTCSSCAGSPEMVQSVLGQLGDQLHRLADDPPEQALHVEHHLVEAQGALGERLAPGEGQELADQRSGALALPLDLPEVGLRRVVHREVEPGERRGALDAGEDVVEVVCHATGEHAHGVHLLGALHLGLEALALGDVAHADHQSLITSGDLGHRQLEVNHGPVAAPRLAGAAALPHVALEARWEQLVRRPSHRLGAGHPEDAARPRGSWTPGARRR